jgi:hypothetical protein
LAGGGGNQLSSLFGRKRFGRHRVELPKSSTPFTAWFFELVSTGAVTGFGSIHPDGCIYPRAFVKP